MDRPTTIFSVKCIEYCQSDKLSGYAIFFSGGWDAYKAGVNGSLLKIGANFQTESEAARALRDGEDWRKSTNA